MHAPHSPPNFSIGTQVVTLADVYDAAGKERPAGAVGVVVVAPTDAGGYTVRFADGGEATLPRDALRVRKAYQRDGMELDDAPDPASLHQFVIYRCVIGSRAYGLDDETSDTDRRGIYLPPADLHWSLAGVPPQLEDPLTRDTYWELEKFLVLALRANPNVLECLATPLVVQTTPAHAELCALVPQLATRHHSHHYLGFAATQWGLFEKEQPRRVKPLLYVYRVLLTGIHLMQTGMVEANLPRLNERFQLPSLPELIARKLAGPEHSALDDANVAFHRAEYERLRAGLEEAHRASTLPEAPAGRAALNDLLVRVRLGELLAGGSA